MKTKFEDSHWNSHVKPFNYTINMFYGQLAKISLDHQEKGTLSGHHGKTHQYTPLLYSKAGVYMYTLFLFQPIMY